jgi:hypothetical protein
MLAFEGPLLIFETILLFIKCHKLHLIIYFVSYTFLFP